MDDETLDPILAEEEELVPTSGFLALVMERVRMDAGAPPPIPFPWKRAVPGMVLTVGVLGWGAVELVRQGPLAVQPMRLVLLHLPFAALRPMEAAGWTAMALAISLASWILARRLAGQSGLL
ncbi:MAG: hypothetical protein WBD67_07140 [Terracidiphilus sp.]